MIKKALSYIAACAILLSPAAVKADRIELGLIGNPAGISVNNGSVTIPNKNNTNPDKDKKEDEGAKSNANNQFLWGIGLFGGQMFGDIENENLEIGYEIQAQFSMKDYTYLYPDNKKNKPEGAQKEKDTNKELLSLSTNNIDFGVLCKCGFFPFEGGNLYGGLGLCGTLALGNPTVKFEGKKLDKNNGKDLQTVIERDLSKFNMGLSTKFGIICLDQMFAADLFGKFYFLEMFKKSDDKQKPAMNELENISVGKNKMDFGINLAFNFMPLIQEN